MDYLSFVYSAQFDRESKRLFTDDEMMSLELSLLENPLQGAAIPHGQGLRKIRAGGKGRGKRGGSRIIYFLRTAEGVIRLLAVYSKNEKEDLTQVDLVKLIKEAHE